MTEFFEGIRGYNEAQGGETETSAPRENEMAMLIAKYG